LKDGISFCSKSSHGWLTEWGATFLKHQFVLNHNRSPGQLTFLPYRESREYLVRAVWGRITKKRDVIDTMLSILGHAYGTYASNRDAYDRLLLFYSELSSQIDLSNLQEELRSRITLDDLKRLRQMGLTADELVSGFPTWEKLVEKNIWDEVYQDITARRIDEEYDFGGDDFDFD